MATMYCIDTMCLRMIYPSMCMYTLHDIMYYQTAFLGPSDTFVSCLCGSGGWTSGCMAMHRPRLQSAEGALGVQGLLDTKPGIFHEFGGSSCWGLPKVCVTWMPAVWGAPELFVFWCDPPNRSLTVTGA